MRAWHTVPLKGAKGHKHIVKLSYYVSFRKLDVPGKKEPGAFHGKYGGKGKGNAVGKHNSAEKKGKILLSFKFIKDKRGDKNHEVVGKVKDGHEFGENRAV